MRSSNRDRHLAARTCCEPRKPGGPDVVREGSCLEAFGQNAETNEVPPKTGCLWLGEHIWGLISKAPDGQWGRSERGSFDIPPENGRSSPLTALKGWGGAVVRLASPADSLRLEAAKARPSAVLPGPDLWRS